MATFDVSFLNKNFRKSNSQDYGFLIDALDIKENQLSSDGKLSPGDLAVLKKEAMKIYAHPGLTADQRSNIEVKISGYDKNSAVTSLKDSQDIERINRDYNNDLRTIRDQISSLSDDPRQTVGEYLKARAAIVENKIALLSEAVDNLEAAGDDSTRHIEELAKASGELQDVASALDATSNYKGGNPTSSMVLNLETNDEGKITDITLSRGVKSGYSETMGSLGGLQVAGKPVKKDGKYVFKLGNDTFSAPDIFIPDPANPGAYKSKPLVWENKDSGGFSVASASQTGFHEIDPSSLQSQGIVPSGGYVKGEKGTIYEKKEDGSYKKFTGEAAKNKEEEIRNQGKVLMTLPRSYESRINSFSNETIDGAPFNPPLPPSGMATSAPASTTPISTPSPSVLGEGRARTGKPIESSPQSAQGQASGLLDKAKGFFANLFN